MVPIAFDFLDGKPLQLGFEEEEESIGCLLTVCRYVQIMKLLKFPRSCSVVVAGGDGGAMYLI